MNALEFLARMREIDSEFGRTMDLEALAIRLLDLQEPYEGMSGLTRVQPEYQKAVDIYRRLKGEVEGTDLELDVHLEQFY